ncbi:MAG: HAD hydrolase-like protein [Clostridia bacterium]|nr:HAD hydrolase-like protein [Clostridia bacterium]
MRPELIIWDFNGTIIDDLALSLEAINTVLKKRNLPLIESEDAYRKAFGFPIIKYYESLGMDFSREPYKKPADEWVKLYNKGADRISLTLGILDVLHKISEMSIPQMILSASETETLIRQLEIYNISSYFDKIIGCDNVYGGGKTEVAKKWATETDISLENALYIGDTDHDYETSIVLGCSCILYSGGHMSKERLEKTGAPVIDRITDILQYMN